MGDCDKFVGKGSRWHAVLPLLQSHLGEVWSPEHVCQLIGWDL